nr:MaoC family dehydratase N-terminal domain-containing protein [Acuticoccus kalidii]
MGDTKVNAFDRISADASTWIGREEIATDEVSGTEARRLAATLNLDPAPFVPGATLPIGWHVTLFPPLAPSAQIGPDGHPKKGDFLPDLGLPRRMFASRKLIFRGDLKIGEPVRRVSRIAEVTPKMGRTGLLAFVTVVHDIHGEDGRIAVTEEQKIVYREEAASGAKKGPAEDRPEGDFEWQREVTPSPALLFRYSAITFNAHRIHYDGDYTREEEGYPERVVNGGLTAILGLTMIAEKHPAPLAEFAVRNRRPLFVNRKVTLMARRTGENETGETGEFCAVDADGFIAATADLVWTRPS